MNSSWRTKLIWLLAAVAFLVLLVAGFYAEENARGLRAWEQCQRDLAARGESLEWTNFIPKPVPDAQNFYKAPMMTEWFVQDELTNSQYPLQSILDNSETYTNDITTASAGAYLTWCSAFDSDFDQIREALKRPATRINNDFSDPRGLRFRPNYVDYRIVAQVLAHRAKCHLVLSESNQALNDLTLLHDFSHTLIGSGKPTTLVEGAIYNAITSAYVDAIACGIESHSWTESQLIALQQQLAEINTLSVFVDSVGRERAAACKIFDTIFASRPVQPQLSSFSAMRWWLMPTGWLIENKVAIVVLEQEALDCINLTNHSVMPSKVKTAALRIDQMVQHPKPWNLIALTSVPNITGGLANFACNQTRVDQAPIACALERYRLAHGQYPPDLATLVPQYLTKIPSDIISGKPMTYVRHDDQHFLLYSVGWNEADDGGIIAHDAKGYEDREHGDWVWHYPMN